MTSLSVGLFLIFVMVATVKADVHQKLPQATTLSSVQHFKEFVASMVQERSSKIQTLLKKIKTNAQSALEKIENIKQDSKMSKKKLNIKSYLGKQGHQIESPVLKNNEVIDTALEAISEGRNFENRYSITGYGASGAQGYGTPHSYATSHNYAPQTYHHHSIGFDPINIVVSMSLLSFLLQALQGLLGRTRLPTPVVEARDLQSIQDWSKSIEDNMTVNNKEKYLLKKKLFKKYYSN